MLTTQAVQQLQAYCKTLQKSAVVEGVDVSKQFAIAPPIETKLRQAIAHSDAFLRMLSFMSVKQISGQVVDVGTGALLTGRVKGGRFRSQLGVDGNTYTLVETDSCAVITWELLTQWANAGSSGEFTKLMNSAITRNFALDILRVGFHGVSVAETTDPEANPLGEDVNKGWLQIAKEKKPGQVLASAILDPTGATEDSFKNLDSLAKDLKNQVIHETHQESPDLVVIVGRDLVAAEQHRLLEAADKPTEHAAAQKLSESIAGMTAYIPPFFPATSIWITSLKNLQILDQEGTQWRKARNEEDRKQFENSWLRMEGYAIGDLDKFAAIEDVTFAEPTP